MAAEAPGLAMVRGIKRVEAYEIERSEPAVGEALNMARF
jgi:hypothetical protein